MGDFVNKVMVRKRDSKAERMREALLNPFLIQREVNNRSLFEFIKFFWPEITQEEFKPNWHIEYLCHELEDVAKRVANHEPKTHDLIINVPPGSTKTITCTIMFPVWCWTRWPHMRFITGSYSGSLALESAETSRDLIRSKRFQYTYPDLEIKEDKDTKSNYKIIKKVWNNGVRRAPSLVSGGNRYSTSVGGTLTGFHGHFLIWDDPINPTQALSDNERNGANRWIDQTASTRKVDKAVSVTIVIMQRLHMDDVTGWLLSKKKANIKHICIPGEIINYREVLKPPELEQFYTNGVMDVNRLPLEVLKDMEADLGQYGYAGQIGQNPTPPKGGMFKVDNFITADQNPEKHLIIRTIRYWDKAGTKDKFSKSNIPYTVGVKMSLLRNGTYFVHDVKRGHWEAEDRERIIRAVAVSDGSEVFIFHEQEPGSGGKESAQATTRNLAGYKAEADLPHGDKIFRADPYSVQVNNSNVSLLKADWNKEFIDEHRFFPFSRFKDQVDASAAAFNKLTSKKRVRSLRNSN